MVRTRIVLCGAAVALFGCGASSGGEVATAQMEATSGSEVSGVVEFRDTAEGVVVDVTLSGLEPRTTHGFHVHTTGDCSAPDGTSAGGHFAPDGHPHGLPPSSPRHAGDMGNVTADAEGRVHESRVVSTLEVEGDRSVIGRAVIVHADRDVGEQPSGGAGERIACGVIRRR